MTATWVRPTPLCFLTSDCGILVYYAMQTRTWFLMVPLIFRQCLAVILRTCQANLLPADSQALDEAGSFEMSLTACQTTRCHNPEHYKTQSNKTPQMSSILLTRCQICVRVTESLFQCEVIEDFALTAGFSNKGVEPSGSICIHCTWRHISPSPSPSRGSQIPRPKSTEHT